MVPDTSHFAGRFLLSVEGTRLQSDVTDLIQRVSYEETEDLSSAITMSVLNPNFEVSQSKMFLEGNKITLWMGYVGKKLVAMNRCVVEKPNPQFPRSGEPTFDVRGLDAATKLMHDSKKGKVWEGRLDSAIMEELLNQHGIAPFVIATSGTVAKRVLKRGDSVWEFMQRLARLNGFVLDVRYDFDIGADVGYFGPPTRVSEQKEKFTFTYGTGESDATLLEFMPDYAVGQQSTNVQMHYVDEVRRKTAGLEVEVGKADRAEKVKFAGADGTDAVKEEIRNGPVIRLSAMGQSEEVLIGRKFGSVKEAKKYVAAWWARREREFVSASGTVVGQPELRKGQRHRFVLPDKRLTGDWILTSVNHEIGQGRPYETRFTASKVVLGSQVGENPSPAEIKAAEVGL